MKLNFAHYITLHKYWSALSFSKILLRCFKISFPFGISILFQYLMHYLVHFNTFSRSLKPILKFNAFSLLPTPRGNPVVVFSSCFMHYHLGMRLLQGNHNMFCNIHIFSATTTAEALLLSIQQLTIVECSGHVQIKFCSVFCTKKILCGFFMQK